MLNASDANEANPTQLQSGEHPQGRMLPTIGISNPTDNAPI